MHCLRCQAAVAQAARYCSSCGGRLGGQPGEQDATLADPGVDAGPNNRQRSDPGRFEVNESHLQLLMDSIPAYVSYVDADQRYRWVNQIYESWFGKPREQIVGQTVRELQGDANYQSMCERIHQVLRGTPIRYEQTLQDSSGQFRVFDTSYIPHQASDGGVLGFYVMVFDITKERQVQQQLRASEERYHQLLESAAESIFVLDSAGQILSANSAAAREHGYTVKELTTMQIQDLHEPQCVSIVPERMRHLEREGQSKFEITHRRKDGSVFPVEVLATVVQLDGKPCFLCFDRDITDRKRLDAALRESEERLRLALSSANQGLWDLNSQTGDAVVTPEYAMMLGCDPATFVETSARWLERLHPDDLERTVANYQAYVSGEISKYSVEYRQRTSVGDWKWIMSQGKIVSRDSAGHPLRMIGTHTDISSLKDVEERLRTSEAQLAEAQRIAKLGSWELDLLTGRLNWSAEIFRIFGMDPATFGASYEAFLNAVHADDRERVNEAYAKSLINREPYEVTHRLQMPDGAIKWVTERCETIFGASGQPLRSIGTVLDVTDRKLAETALLASEEAYRALFEQAAVGMISGTVEGKILRVNRRLCEMLGYSPDELCNLGPIGLSHPDDITLDMALFAKLVAGELQSYQVEKRYLHRNGQVIWGNLTLTSRHEEGRIVEIIGVIQDITERKQAEEARQESEQRFRLLVEYAPYCIHELDQEGRFLSINQAGLRMLGEIDEARMVSRRYLNCVSDADRPRIADLLQEARGGRMSEFVFKSQNDRCFSSNFVPLANRRIIGITVDITEHKRAEEQLRSERNFTSAVLDNAGALVVVLDQEGRIRRFNRAAEQLSGRSFAEVEGQFPWDTVLPPEAAETIRKQAFESLVVNRDKTITKYTNEWLTRSGERRLIEWTNTLLYDDSNQMVDFMVSIGIDVTEQKQAEASLRASEERFRLVWEYAADGMRLTDLQGRIHAVNEAFCDVFGKSSDEIVGQNMTTLYEEADRAHILAGYRERFERGEIARRLERPMTLYDGRKVWFEVSNCFIETDPTCPLLLAIFRDITERKQAEELLQASEQKSRAILNALPDLLFRVQRNGVFVDCRAPVKNALLAPVEKIIGGRITDFLPPEVASLADKHVQAALASNQVQIFDYSLLTPSGKRYFEARVAVSGWDEVVVIVRDITEHGLAEAERLQTLQNLRRSEERFSKLFYSSPASVVVATYPDSIIVDVNDAFLRIFGFQRADVIGKITTDLDIWLNPSDRLLLLECLRNGRARDLEFGFRTKAGELRTLLITAELIEVHGQLHSVTMSIDITERKQADEIHRTHSQLLLSMSEGVSFIDVQGVIRMTNPALNAMFGYDAGELIGQPVTILNDANPSEHQVIAAEVMGAIETHGVWSGEFRNRRKDGSVFWTSARISPFQIHDERRFVLVQQDVTVRKNAEEQIAALQNQLAHAARLGILGELASGLAHELNQPLAALHMYASASMKLLELGSSAELGDCLQQIRTQSLRAGEIIRRMRGFCTPNTSRRNVVSVNQLVQEVLMILAVDLRHSNIKPQLHLTERLPLVLVDSIQIQQVLVNLIRNAMDALAATPISQRSITIEADKHGNEVVLSVADSGEGIDSTISDKLFQAFQTTKATGVGLGLAVSRTIIEVHGGKIWAEPNPNGGSIFYITLPIESESM